MTPVEPVQCSKNNRTNQILPFEREIGVHQRLSAVRAIRPEYSPADLRLKVCGPVIYCAKLV